MRAKNKYYLIHYLYFDTFELYLKPTMAELNIKGSPGYDCRIGEGLSGLVETPEIFTETSRFFHTNAAALQHVSARVLYNQFFLDTLLPELFRGTALFLSEYAVEVRQIVEAATVTNFRDVPVGVDQQTDSQAQPVINDEVRHVFSRPQLEEAAERSGRHIRQLRQFSQGYLLGIMQGDVILHVQDAPRLLAPVELRIRSGRQLPVFALRQFVQDGQKLKHGIESVALRRELVQHAVYPHYPRHGKSYPALRVFHHLLYRLKLAFLQQAVRED